MHVCINQLMILARDEKLKGIRRYYSHLVYHNVRYTKQKHTGKTKSEKKLNRTETVKAVRDGWAGYRVKGLWKKWVLSQG